MDNERSHPALATTTIYSSPYLAPVATSIKRPVYPEKGTRVLITNSNVVYEITIDPKT